MATEYTPSLPHHPHTFRCGESTASGQTKLLSLPLTVLVGQLGYQHNLVTCGILPCVYYLIYCSLIVTLLKSALYGQLWEGFVLLDVAVAASGCGKNFIVGCGLPNQPHSHTHPRGTPVLQSFNFNWPDRKSVV